MTVRHTFLVALVATVLAHPASAAIDPAVVTADGAFVKAATAGDAKGVDALLDQDLTWTDMNGATVTKTQAVKALPTLAITKPAGADTKQFDYGNVAVVLVDYRRLERYAYVVYAATLLLVLAVPVVGTVGGGANWRALVCRDVEALMELCGAAERVRASSEAR